MLQDPLNNTIVHKWEHIFYPTIPFTWILSSLTVIGSAFIIRYLMTKPMIAQTIMDFGNKILFFYVIANTLIMSIFISLALASSVDYGEVSASIIGYVGPTSYDIYFTQLCAIFIVQAMMVKNPEYLDDNTFENGIRCIMGIAIPLSHGIIYLILYFVAEPTAIYKILRDRDQDVNGSEIFLLVKGCTFIPLGLGSAINLLYTIKIQQNNFIQSNHILNRKVVLVLLTGQFMLGATIFTLHAAFKYRGNTFFSQGTTLILLPLVGQVIKMIFILTIVLSHGSVRDYVSNLFIIRDFTSLLSLRQARQIDVRQ